MNNPNVTCEEIEKHISELKKKNRQTKKKVKEFQQNIWEKIQGIQGNPC